MKLLLHKIKKKFREREGRKDQWDSRRNYAK